MQKGGIVKSAVFFKRQYWKNGSIVKTVTFSFGIMCYLRNRKYLFETLKWAAGKVGGAVSGGPILGEEDDCIQESFILAEFTIG